MLVLYSLSVFIRYVIFMRLSCLSWVLWHCAPVLELNGRTLLGLGFCLGAGGHPQNNMIFVLFCRTPSRPNPLVTEHAFCVTICIQNMVCCARSRCTLNVYVNTYITKFSCRRFSLWVQTHNCQLCIVSDSLNITCIANRIHSTVQHQFDHNWPNLNQSNV